MDKRSGGEQMPRTKQGEGLSAKPKAKKAKVEIDRLLLEKEMWAEGYEKIAGVDEVGRGCMFGDVVAAAVILPTGLKIEGIDDSKKLSEKKRDELYDVIMREAIAVAVGRVDPRTIDRINIKQASRLAMKMAVEALGERPDCLLVDAEKIEADLPQRAVIKGDSLSQSIGAASIIAKVTRDRLCAGEWERDYPGYGIAGHKGYGTAAHREKILELGISDLHRHSFLVKMKAEYEQLR
ncbi:ribonuclease HII [Saccharibacillus alkalitolerans]|uniref:Ribonuclease HII n=1 Tax=Saccharibacillus alkalitolerans TaxID=2705290 RepID=A0ABX0F6H3_9BACL|nr:ribonuclease HII [Saccharibacillus alkalitolerans]NGZ75525.1 ribonuclease HII [Saccharibacillus alkalitolerans]